MIGWAEDEDDRMVGADENDFFDWSEDDWIEAVKPKLIAKKLYALLHPPMRGRGNPFPSFPIPFPLFVRVKRDTYQLFCVCSAGEPPSNKDRMKPPPGNPSDGDVNMTSNSSRGMLPSSPPSAAGQPACCSFVCSSPAVLLQISPVLQLNIR